MKVKDLAVIVKLDDGNVYQVILDKQEQNAIERVILSMNNGVIKALDTPIEGIDLE